MMYDVMMFLFFVAAIVPWAVLFHKEPLVVKYVLVVMQFMALGFAVVLGKLG